MIRAVGLCLLIQVAAVVVTLGVFRVGTNDAWIAAGIYLISSSFIFAYWIKLLSDIRLKDSIAAEREKYLAERERIKLQAEQEKLNLVRDTHKLVSKEAAKASARANTKVGLIAAVAVVGGVTLIAAQMFALGILTLSTAGGGLAGYLMRLRQEKANKEKRLTQQWVRADEAEMEDTLEVIA
ncbi:MAG: hypothetical protein ACPGSC_13815, partial [Granulosicoccaceae bacterium]